MNDMAAVGKAPLRSKAATLDLKRESRKCKNSTLDRPAMAIDSDRAVIGRSAGLTPSPWQL
ncbi:hypothetical protein CR492_08285 [Methylocella silvestris]|uniref:Uncharacterized protein n=2 Tax=Methylocella silvestris TaxID=199596 RepID=A0A2J7TI13_METSI|nr:hypothetical protein CR492_08285 [Methylocella silvestris]